MRGCCRCCSLSWRWSAACLEGMPGAVREVSPQLTLAVAGRTSCMQALAGITCRLHCVHGTVSPGMHALQTRTRAPSAQSRVQCPPLLCSLQLLVEAACSSCSLILASELAGSRVPCAAKFDFDCPAGPCAAPAVPVLELATTPLWLCWAGGLQLTNWEAHALGCFLRLPAQVKC